MQIPLGPFTLTEVIGRGGMGVVLRGEYARDGVPVAVKVLKGKGAWNRSMIDAFHNEVRAVAGLDHPGIVRVYDYGQIPAATTIIEPTLIDQSPYLVMEFAEGGTLTPLRGCCSWPEARGILLGLLDALAHAHARGVVHRDLKPANVLLTERGVVLSDFGLAMSPEARAQLKGHSLSGTPGYMAPEQFEGDWQAFGPWTDLYALGCLTYSLLSGSPPFGRLRYLKASFAHRVTTAPPLQPARPVPIGLGGWLARLLQKDPHERFQSAADAAWALLQLDSEPALWRGGELTVSAVPAAPASATYVVASPAQTLPWNPTMFSSTVESGAVRVLPTQAPPADSLVAIERPPIPEDWRMSRASGPARPSGLGLGLWGLRSVPLVGRDEARDALWSALRRVIHTGRPGAVVCTGEAGVGKSRLADWLGVRAQEVGAAAALRVTFSRPEGIDDGLVPMLTRHLRLHEMGRREVAVRLQARFRELSPEAIARSTELLHPLAPGADPAGVVPVTLADDAAREDVLVALLGSLCVERALVIVVDDIQRGPSAMSLLRRLVERERLPILLVVTTREEALVMGSLPGVTRLAVEPLDEQHRAELVEELLGLSGEAARQVERRTQGNPLFAIQLVGDWVERGILEVGYGGFVIAEGAEVPIPEAVHTFWEARLNRLLAAHPPDARVALELAAMLGGAVDETEWSEACAEAGVSSPWEVVFQLLDRGLAHQREPGAWRFAHGMLAESIRRSASEAWRLVDHQRAVGAALTRCGGRHNKRGALRQAEGSLSRAEALLEGSPHQALWMDAAVGLADIWQLRGKVVQAEPLLRGALAAASRGDRGREAAALSALGTLCFRQGRGREAREHYEAALAIDRELGNRAREGHTLGNLGNVHLYTDGGLALERYTAALAIHREVGDRREEGVVLANLGMLFARQGKRAEALGAYEHALTIQREVGDRRAESVTLSALGTLYRNQGRYDDALLSYERAIALQASVGDQHAEGMTRCNLGILQRHRGEHVEALAQLEQGLAIFQLIGNRRSEGLALSNLGSLHRWWGRNDEALKVYTRALAVHRTFDNRYVEGQTLCSLGDLLRELGRYEEASDTLERALSLLSEGGTRRSEGLTRGFLGHLRLGQGALEEAGSLLQEGIASMADVGYAAAEGAFHGLYGVLLAKRGLLDEARSALGHGAALLADTGVREELGKLRCRLAAVERSAGDEGAAEVALGQAMEIAAAVEAPPEGDLATMIRALTPPVEGC